MKCVINDIDLDPEKYILIKTDIFKAFNQKAPTTALELVELIKKYPESVIFYQPRTEDEFFVMMVKDVHSRKGLIGYARSAVLAGQTKLATAVQLIAERAGFLSPYVKHPD